MNSNETPTRLTWDEMFVKIIQATAQRSPCHRLQVGCILVKDKRIISQGYNGFLPGCEHKSIVALGAFALPSPRQSRDITITAADPRTTTTRRMK